MRSGVEWQLLSLPGDLKVVSIRDVPQVSGKIGKYSFKGCRSTIESSG